MNTLIKKFFKPAFERFNEVQPSMAIDLATAVLMVEVSKGSRKN